MRSSSLIMKRKSKRAIAARRPSILQRTGSSLLLRKHRWISRKRLHSRWNRGCLRWTIKIKIIKSKMVLNMPMLRIISKQGRCLRRGTIRISEEKTASCQLKRNLRRIRIWVSQAIGGGMRNISIKSWIRSPCSPEKMLKIAKFNQSSNLLKPRWLGQLNLAKISTRGSKHLQTKMSQRSHKSRIINQNKSTEHLLHQTST